MKTIALYILPAFLLACTPAWGDSTAASPVTTNVPGSANGQTTAASSNNTNINPQTNTPNAPVSNASVNPNAFNTTLGGSSFNSGLGVNTSQGAPMTNPVNTLGQPASSLNTGVTGTNRPSGGAFSGSAASGASGNVGAMTGVSGPGSSGR